jgi:hypothetical protein
MKNELISRLETRRDNAYLAYIDHCRSDGCLGEDAKLGRGIFGEKELRAHKKAAECLGKSRAFAEALEMVREELP